MKKQVLIVLVVLVLASVASATIQYTIIDLGTLGGNDSSARGINDSGQVVGRSYTAGDSERHAFLYDGGTMHDLGTLGGTYSYAYDINNSGQIVGDSYTAGDYYRHAFLYDGGTMHDLGTLGGTHSFAWGMSDSGQVVGQSDTAGDSERHAFLYDGGTMHDLGTLGGTGSFAYDINNSGQVVGYSSIAGDSERHAFLYDGGTMHDLGTFERTHSYSYAWSINDSGQVVGYSNGRAFLYDGGTMNDLGTLGGTVSYAYDINNSGQVVGESYTAGNSERHAFLYDEIKGMLDLNTVIPPSSGWELHYAVGINSSGQIVGYGEIGGETNAFIMTPVPEPTYSPVADAGDDVTVYAGPDGTATVKLDGSGSFDVDGDELEYFWFDDANDLIATGAEPNVVFAAGVHVIELVVDDGTVSSEPNSVVVTVIEAIEARAYVFPRVLNAKSRGRYVIARMELPDGVSKDDVADDSLVLIIGDTVIESIRQRRISSRGQDYVFGFFDRDEVIAQADGKTKLDIVIAGELATGQCVYGEDSIKVVKSNGPKKPAPSRRPVRNSRGSR